MVLQQEIEALPTMRTVIWPVMASRESVAGLAMDTVPDHISDLEGLATRTLPLLAEYGIDCNVGVNAVR